MKAYICLGSNLGNRRKNILGALKYLSMVENTRIIRRTRIYNTKPEDNTHQPDFLNCAVEVETSLPARKLLKELQKIETKLGRIRKYKWEPRTIDMDILLYGNLRMKTRYLTIPHPRLARRKFVIDLLYKLIPDYTPPGFKYSIRQIREKIFSD